MILVKLNGQIPNCRSEMAKRLGSTKIRDAALHNTSETSVKMFKSAKKKAAAQKRDSLPYPYKRIKRLKRFSSSGSPWDTKTDKSNSNEDCLPTNVPLFRYHRFNWTRSQNWTASMHCRITKENSRAPRGSPCCTSEKAITFLLSNCSSAGWEQHHFIQA